MAGTPLAVLDLVPISAGSTAADALRNSIDLAQQAERLGYARYWFAEHHLNPGVAGTSPAVVLALTAAATRAIRIGSGAVQMGHRTALSVVEEFGLIDALHPGRLDLGLGRSGGRPAPVQQVCVQQVGVQQGIAPQDSAPQGWLRQGPPPAAGPPPRMPPPTVPPPTVPPPTVPPATEHPATEHPAAGAAPASGGYAPNGLRIPAKFDPGPLLNSPRFALQRTLLQLPRAESQDYGAQVGDVLALLAGRYQAADGTQAHAVPGEGADVQVWILGSSGGQSAEVAGRNGLRFAANYHVSPATVLEAAAGYRAAFRPSAALAQPYVCVSADVVVAHDQAAARELASGYGMWVRSIRTGEGAIEFPTAAQARAHPWTDDDRALVADRTQTQFVGSPGHVADQLERLRDATEADELIITTITHAHADRVRSYELLAQEWSKR
jgi:alkanesulfonate monooxygenase SsuD/methylene tetrahydromethanopterin reductase-like flavin-dependent oxidoreductase (luciferase family)